MNKIVTGKKIKQVRLALKMSQNSFANKLDVNQGALSQLENGQVGPSLELLLRIAKMGNVTTDWLLDDEENKEKKGKRNENISPVYKDMIARLELVLQEEKLSLADLSIRCQLNLGRMQKIIGLEEVINLEEFLKIVKALPDYNANWLLRSQGSRKVKKEIEVIEELLEQKAILMGMLRPNPGENS